MPYSLPDPTVTSTPRMSSSWLRRVATLLCIVAMLCPAPQLLAASATSLLSIKMLSVKGSATNIITSIEFINDVTLQIEAVQVGHLSNFGDFTGQFSYTAVASPVSILLTGNATLTNTSGEQLTLVATILEVGVDYPYTVTGTLTITGGTGRFAGATGTIAVTGQDGEELTDTFQLAGTILTLR
jgi:hypothetical protein